MADTFHDAIDAATTTRKPRRAAHATLHDTHRGHFEDFQVTKAQSAAAAAPHEAAVSSLGTFHAAKKPQGAHHVAAPRAAERSGRTGTVDADSIGFDTLPGGPDEAAAPNASGAAAGAAATTARKGPTALNENAAEIEKEMLAAQQAMLKQAGKPPVEDAFDQAFKHCSVAAETAAAAAETAAAAADNAVVNGAISEDDFDF